VNLYAEDKMLDSRLRGNDKVNETCGKA